MSFLVRMTHPEHGAMHVYEQSELERHEKLGWTADKHESPKVIEPPKKRGRPRKVEA